MAEGPDVKPGTKIVGTDKPEEQLTNKGGCVALCSLGGGAEFRPLVRRKGHEAASSSTARGYLHMEPLRD